LLDYDIQENKFVSDLASCDTSNLLYIECFLENNLKWSDGTDITADDVIATLNLIKKTEVNPNISSLLAETTIEK
jgi:MarR-like DNA-binding transcriptional regulator SgrR of sgrS sRNA